MPIRQKPCNFSFKKFKIRFLRFWKCLKTTWLNRASCWINSKARNKDKNTSLMIFLFCYHCKSLLWCNYSKSLILWNSTFWSPLKLTVQIQLAFYPCDLFLIHNRNINVNSVKKIMFCYVEYDSRRFVVLHVTYFFRLEHHYHHSLFCSKFLQILAQACHLCTGTESLNPYIVYWVFCQPSYVTKGWLQDIYVKFNLMPIYKTCKYRRECNQNQTHICSYLRCCKNCQASIANNVI